MPRWYLDRVMTWFTNGHVDVKNPFNKRTYQVSLKPADVHSIVWWSKDYSEYVKHHDFFDGYNQFFHFTINGYSDPGLRFLEPGMTASLDERLEQLGKLVDLHGAGAVSWRFDPVVFWREDGGVRDNTGDFLAIAKRVAALGIRTCITSMATWYGKCERRAKRKGFNFVEPTLAMRIQTGRRLVAVARKHGIAVKACCSEGLTRGSGMGTAACIDGELLSRLFDEQASRARDGGQRESCNCTKSKDIGSYDLKCKHGCVYCYGNPA